MLRSSSGREDEIWWGKMSVEDTMREEIETCDVI
jgi:hypothetical protein